MVHCSHQDGAKKKAGHFFSPEEDSDNEDNPVNSEEKTDVSSAVLTKLPNPLSGVTHNSEDDDDRQTSVFTNYFHKAEEAKLAVLEHHVKLTTEQIKTKNEQTKQKNRKAICISFQRGRCRFGAKCRFAHNAPAGVHQTGMDTSSEMSAPKFGLLPSARMPLTIEPEDDEDADKQKKRKHRSGVNDGLVPPKRAMKSLEQQRQHERPWTVTHQ